MSYLRGKLIYPSEKKHTQVEWLRFLKQIHREVPKDFDVHLIADNCSTHAKVKAWLKLHKRFHMRFTPTSTIVRDRLEPTQPHPLADRLGESEPT